MLKSTFYFTLYFILLLVTACNAQTKPDGQQIMKDVKYLASDELEGRNSGSEGGKKARAYVIKRFREVGLSPVKNDSYESPFSFKSYSSSEVLQGVNIIGQIKGKTDEVIVITAHYDHIGVKNGNIHNGADDNASGVSGLLAIATYFKENPPQHTLIFVAFDAEENGLRGAKHFVNNFPVDQEKVKLNINMDMISRSDKNEIYAAGTYHYPHLKKVLEEVAKNSPVKLSLGHDKPELGHDDWTNSSDHGPFHEKGIPFIYFGVEDHEDYHKPTDDAEKINPQFLTNTITTILETIKKFDQE